MTTFFYKRLGIFPHCRIKLQTLKNIDSFTSKIVVWFWIVAYFIIAIGVAILEYWWFRIKVLPIISAGINKQLILYLLILSLGIFVATGGFFMPAFHYIKLLVYSLQFNKKEIFIIFANKQIKKYKWKEVQAIKWNIIEGSHYSLVFKDGFKYPLPHWPGHGIPEFFSCLLKHKPKLKWEIELYLRDIYN